MTTLEEVFEDYKQFIEKEGLTEGDYCIVCLAGKHGCKGLRFVYKNYERFKERAQEDQDSIDSMFQTGLNESSFKISWEDA